MNIAFIGNFSLHQVNGVSYSGYQVARQFACSNNNMFIYNFSESTSSKQHESGVIERTFRYSFKKIGWSSEFANFIKENSDNIEVFHLHSVFTPYNYFTSRLLKALNLPYVISSHGGYCRPVLLRNKFLKQLYMTLFEKRVLRNAKGMIAVTEQEIKDIRNVGYKGPVRVIPNPVVMQASAWADVDPGETVNIIFMGRYDIQHKGLDFLLDTFKLLYIKNSNITLTLYGDGADKEILLNKIKSEHIQNVTVYGPVFGEEKEYVLRRASLFIQPSQWEVFGITLIEAMMLARPVVLTEGCYLSALFRKNDVGLIVPFEPEKAAVLLNKYLESSSIQVDGIKNQIFAKREFALDKVASETLNFYSSIF